MSAALLTRDIMNSQVVIVRPDLPVTDLCDVFQQEHIHGCPVVGEDGELVGFVSQEDVLFGSMGHAPRPAGSDEPVQVVGDIMTSPAVFATEETRMVDVCRLMWQLRIHHVPVVRTGRVTGIVSSLDLCRVVGEGKVSA